ncbi:hypothetical protein Sango_1605100 [Sesamum angolense]|uniref:Retrotransposon gag domain-containing protein n=1 Tax=Sesamum angolense TaxID=2727404 RepID=A0AAE1WJ92_9LAMI|nr:hypothetical protein Sango_1605100 [Sesamum angolense]
MMEYSFPTADGTIHRIAKPNIEANNSEIKPSIIQIIWSSVQFSGLHDEDLNKHLINFLVICDTFKLNGVSNNAVKLRIFPFSLCDTAKDWFRSLPAGSITTWAALTQKFLAKYFPPAKTAKMLNDITSFVQLDRESLYYAWERFKSMLRECPHHELHIWRQKHYNIDEIATNLSNFNPYSNTYNLGWRSHPNFSWSNNQQQRSPRYHQLQQQAPKRRKAILKICFPNSSLQQTPIPKSRSINLKFGSANGTIDMEEDKNMSLILGRSFLATSRALIDVQKGQLTLKVNDEDVVFTPPLPITNPPTLPAQHSTHWPITLSEPPPTSPVTTPPISLHRLYDIEGNVILKCGGEFVLS